MAPAKIQTLQNKNNFREQLDLLKQGDCAKEIGNCSSETSNKAHYLRHRVNSTCWLLFCTPLLAQKDEKKKTKESKSYLNDDTGFMFFK